MLVKVFGAAMQGIDALTVTIEVNCSQGIHFYMVGLADTAVRESHERIRSALQHNGYKFPHRQLIINLAPADLRKEGSAYDLPLAIGILAAAEEISANKLSRYMIMGELSLDGSILPIRGALPIAIQARAQGFDGLIVPKANVREAAVVDKLHVYGVENICEVVDFFNGERELTPTVIDTRAEFFAAQNNFDLDFADVKGQESVKRAFEVAAAGGHNLIMIGPPGAGKSMMAKRIASILPPLTLHEALETTKIHSVAGKMERNSSLLTQRPFRAPHHTISPSALAGGGRIPRPGEISLAHKGVLFLDELAEFKRETIEILRQPMEERRVHISRVYGSYVFPADCMIVAATNFCKCGNFPNLEKCICSEAEIRRYQSRISRPILDRMDISVEAVRVDYDALICEKKSEDSKTIRKRVELAGQIQRERYRDTGYRYNADLDAAGIKKYCRTGEKEKKVLRDAYEKMDLTARACHKILKVARTIADMEQKEQIAEEHLYEAIGYRIFEQRQIWR